MTAFLALLLLAQEPEPPPVLFPVSELRVVPQGKGYQLSWTPSPTDSGISRYEIYRDGEHVGETKPPEHGFLDQAPEGVHTYFVRSVKDGAYVDSKPVKVGKIQGFKARQDWRAFAFSGYKLRWKPVKGPVKIWKNGSLVITLPPGQTEFVDNNAVRGETGYGIQDASTGEEVVPEVTEVWSTVNFKGTRLWWDVPGYDSLLLMRSVGEGPPVPVAKVPARAEGFLDQGTSHLKKYRYFLEAEDGSMLLASEAVQPPWYDFSKSPDLVFIIIFGLAFFMYLMAAKSGRGMFIRKIAGLEELDNAVGRSTELGRPILYVPGIGMIANLQTIAMLTILKHVAKKAAEYETKVIMPNYDPLVMAAAKEVVKEAYTEVGRPDLYNEDDVFFVTQQQFAFAAAVDGIIVRERPGANFFIGVYYAESLVISETGYSIGAIQIAGTAQTVQIPFFLATCDYTLIGEELYAASAYLSRNAIQIATLKAEDIFKALISVAIAGFSLLAGFGALFTLLR